MTKPHKVVHQFGLFGYQRPVIRMKLGFPKAKMEEAKRLYEQGDYAACAAIVREFREKLEAFESRLGNGKAG